MQGIRVEEALAGLHMWICRESPGRPQPLRLLKGSGPGRRESLGSWQALRRPERPFLELGSCLKREILRLALALALKKPGEPLRGSTLKALGSFTPNNVGVL